MTPNQILLRFLSSNRSSSRLLPHNASFSCVQHAAHAHGTRCYWMRGPCIRRQSFTPLIPNLAFRIPPSDVVGFDIDHASGKLDLSSVETIALPPVSAAE